MKIEPQSESEDSDADKGIKQETEDTEVKPVVKMEQMDEGTDAVKKEDDLCYQCRIFGKTFHTLHDLGVHKQEQHQTLASSTKD